MQSERTVKRSMSVMHSPAGQDTPPVEARFEVRPSADTSVLTYIPILLRRELEAIFGRALPHLQIGWKQGETEPTCEVLLPGAHPEIVPEVARRLHPKYSVNGHAVSDAMEAPPAVTA